MCLPQAAPARGPAVSAQTWPSPSQKRHGGCVWIILDPISTRYEAPESCAALQLGLPAIMLAAVVCSHQNTQQTSTEAMGSDSLASCYGTGTGTGFWAQLKTKFVTLPAKGTQRGFADESRIASFAGCRNDGSPIAKSMHESSQQASNKRHRLKFSFTRTRQPLEAILHQEAASPLAGLQHLSTLCE